MQRLGLLFVVAGLGLIACSDDDATASATTDTGTPADTGSRTSGASGSGDGDDTTTGATATGGENGGSAGQDAGDNSGGPPVPGLDSRPTNASCVAPERPRPASSASVERAFESLTFDNPVGMFQPSGNTDYWYVIEQDGKVQRFENRSDVASASEVLSVSTAFGGGNDERGLLGLAFHPDFATNGHMYVHYVAPGNVSRLVRYTTSDGGGSFGSSVSLLEVDQPASNHNGGHIVFGPDGYLYVALGDGGGANDSFGNGQEPDTLLGTILRLDVDGGSPYAIPADNPFADGGGAAEIYAWGLRNPWRFSFDSLTGELWAADVGQGCAEEVDRIERGDNLGWPLLEGFSCFSVSNSRAGCPDERDCAAANDSQYTPPVFTYPRSQGVSVTGGYVYRGSRIPALEGTYVFGDFDSGRLWGTREKSDGSFETEQLLDGPGGLASFAQAADGELYLVYRGEGVIRSLAPGNDTAVDTLPAKLSETGCVDPSDPTQMADGVLPYTLRVPFWSDGARKDRYLALPDGSTLSVDEHGDWTLPPGGVTIKTFWIDDKRVETRFFVRHPDGEHSGYTYEWNDEQTDATLLRSRKQTATGDQQWYFPSRGECLGCHTPAAGFSLGLESRQLDAPLEYPGGTEGNQIVTLDHIGLFDSPQKRPKTSLARLDDDDAPLEARARAYLHVNCSHCHRPGASGRGTADLRVHATDAGICNAEPTAGTLGVDGAKLLVPGDPEKSLLTLRATRRGPDGMPPVASLRVDPDAEGLLTEWVRSLNDCP